MRAEIDLRINGRPVRVPEGVTVWTALVRAGHVHARRSPSGEPRGALCGMGVCFECRVTIDGVAHRRSCQVECVEGMEITLDD
ncbi:MAG TPA: (2Fe-2S)-binding protein [Gemmatimonadota bacterium]|nr:(2Fe-2S)-binding protein [Gemmatimonadota bacterium]